MPHRDHQKNNQQHAERPERLRHITKPSELPPEEHPYRQADHVVFRVSPVTQIVESTSDVRVAVVAADVVHSLFVGVVGAEDGGVVGSGERVEGDVAGRRAEGLERENG